MKTAHDPAFAAIERHKSALTNLNAACEAASIAKLAADLDAALLTYAGATDEAEKAAYQALEDARTAVAVTTPATAQGASAVINYILDGMDQDDAEDLRDYEKAALRAIAAALPDLK
jgi:hypothetical protein